MAEASTIGLDIAKAALLAHDMDARRQIVFSRRLTRTWLLQFFAAQPRSVVALEACGKTYHWARESALLGNEMKLIPPVYSHQHAGKSAWKGKKIGASLPKTARVMFLVITGQLEQLTEQIKLLNKENARRARELILRIFRALSADQGAGQFCLTTPVLVR